MDTDRRTHIERINDPEPMATPRESHNPEPSEPTTATEDNAPNDETE